MNVRRLQWIAAVAAALSAGFWALSAAVTFPPMLTYWGATPPSDPYQMAVHAAARWNTFSAGFAAIAAGAQALALGLASRRR
jgi:hypothetical protein